MIKPLKDIVLLRMKKQQLGIVGGIHIPEVGRLSGKTGGRAEVVAVGKDVEELKVGDVVHLSVYDKMPVGTDIEVDGEKLILIKERDVNGKYED